MTHVVVVESPAKAKTINKYLGSDYTVLASYGHIRDLPSKNGSVRPDSDFEMDWEVDSRSQKHIKDIADAVKTADHLYLATDPDREGEAISWHVQQVLTEKKLLDNAKKNSVYALDRLVIQSMKEHSPIAIEQLQHDLSFFLTF